jgi:hypothetical protein
MQSKSLRFATALAAIAFQHGCHAYAQTVKPKSIMGTVAELRVESRELVVTTENGNTLPVKVSMDTEFLRVPPGVHDLSKAAPASPHDIKAGDHVLVSYVDGMTEARRVVFMPAAAIDARNEAERADWETRGLAGMVAAKTGNEIIAQLPGDVKSTIAVTPKTKFRRYAPDSVTFTQATKSSITEISPGDQIRARGEKSPDGLTMTADEVVFGTFWTKAGTITAIDPHTHEVTIQEVGTKKPLVVKVAAESKLKMLPNMHMAEASGAVSHGGAPEHVPTTPSGAVDIAKVLSNMPVCNMDDLKIGGAVLVSSTKGATEGKITAIMLLANAEMFVQLMQQQAEGNGGGMEQFLKGHGMNPAQGMSLPAILQ